jgi:hypothetical protein
MPDRLERVPDAVPAPVKVIAPVMVGEDARTTLPVPVVEALTNCDEPLVPITVAEAGGIDPDTIFH